MRIDLGLKEIWVWRWRWGEGGWKEKCCVQIRMGFVYFLFKPLHCGTPVIYMGGNGFLLIVPITEWLCACCFGVRRLMNAIGFDQLSDVRGLHKTQLDRNKKRQWCTDYARGCGRTVLCRSRVWSKRPNKKDNQVTTLMGFLCGYVGEVRSNGHCLVIARGWGRVRSDMNEGKRSQGLFLIDFCQLWVWGSGRG